LFFNNFWVKRDVEKLTIQDEESNTIRISAHDEGVGVGGVKSVATCMVEGINLNE